MNLDRLGGISVLYTVRVYRRTWTSHQKSRAKRTESSLLRSFIRSLSVSSSYVFLLVLEFWVLKGHSTGPLWYKQYKPYLSSILNKIIPWLIISDSEDKAIWTLAKRPWHWHECAGVEATRVWLHNCNIRYNKVWFVQLRLGKQ